MEEGWCEQDKRIAHPGGAFAADVESGQRPGQRCGEAGVSAIGKLDLAALTELKRVSSGTVELKFTDRMRALETLYKLVEQEREGGRLDAFYAELDGDEAE